LRLVREPFAGSKVYTGLILCAQIGGVDIVFTVELQEPITDPAKLPRLRLTAERGEPFTVRYVAADAEVSLTPSQTEDGK